MSRKNLDRVQEMYDFYVQPHSLKDTGRQFGITKQCVQQSFKRHGYKIRPPYITLKHNKGAL